MLRRHPLTLMLLLTTLVVDVTLVNIHLPMNVGKRGLLAGLLFGQTAVLAMWAAWGGGHRLARVSTLVVITCLLSLYSGGRALLGTYQWLAILIGYALAVYVFAVVLSFWRHYRSTTPEHSANQPAWQVSLIELFGWTILVAIVSFVARSMEFDFARLDRYVIEKTLLALTVPFVFASQVREREFEIGPGKAILVFCLSPLVGFLLRIYEPLFATPLVLSQAGYLVLWFFVRGLDRKLQHETNADESQTEAEPQDGLSNQADS